MILKPNRIRFRGRFYYGGESGFALIVTLLMMVLLTIIGVGLLTLSSISLRSSSQGEANAVARSNARLALMMAIGELQKEMGPDTRISAPNDAGAAPSGGRPRWTAVYEAWKWNSDPATAEVPSSRPSPANKAPTFRGWLVSGANQATGGIGGVGEDVLLAGPNSLAAGNQPTDQIKVPLQGIKLGNQTGRFGWWISDESTKAKINAGALADSLAAATSPLTDSQSPPSVGHKAVTELKDFVWKKGERGVSVSNGVVNLAAALPSKGLGSLSHDITVHSAGVLSDVREGRLKRDLTNLLSRSISELENKPLYLADGRINRFNVTDQGEVSNMAALPVNASGANRWGINLEELHLFHQIHREVDWSSGRPRLVNKNSRSAIINDRFFIYRKPTLEAVSQILSFIASPEAGTTPTTYRIDANMDTIVALSNPNDIPTVWPASVFYRVDTEGFPYRPDWNISRGGTVIVSHRVDAINSSFFQSAIKSGFTLEPGEAAVFGATATDTQATQVNLTRGYAPRGGVRIDDGAWDEDNKVDAGDGFRATRLLPTDKMDFEMVPAGSGLGNTPSGWISSYANISDGAGGATSRIATYRLGGGGNSSLATAPTSTYMPGSIRPTSTPLISSFIGKPMPVIMVTTMTNVEKSRTSVQPPNALPSRPYLIHEPATGNMIAITNQASNTLLTMQNSQLVTIAEPMDYTFGNDRTMADSTGLNLYHGGSREAALGGSKNVVKRRIPLVAPLSIGAFENAIACGFTGRYAGGSALSPDPGVLITTPAQRVLGTGLEPQASMVTMSKSIGNSWSNPFLTSDKISDGTYHDPSWMVNTALWDSWFLSGIVPPNPSTPSTWGGDPRSARDQFNALAQNQGNLRNKRYLYYAQKPLNEALTELFDGSNFKPAAINKLPKYLLVDGAFNVNSTSVVAWKAFLASVRDQELLDAAGSKQKKNLPFGTLGYAVKSSTSGTEGDWNGFRDLTDTELDGLAKAIVVEVKARGPFLNMADFVNRRPNSPDATQRALGAIQAAIDKSGLNNRFKASSRTLLAPDTNSADIASLTGKDTFTAEPTPARAVGGAGYLSQAALLTAFGSQITVRGDTFVIRTYGDSRDKSGAILAKSWCEAVVQRTPDYVNPVDAPDSTAKLAPVNTLFGRKLKVISFRWLKPEEV